MEKHSSVRLENRDFTVIKPTRLCNGMVLHNEADNVYARLGEKQTTLEEQIHTTSLLKKGFPVPTVLSSGEYEDKWYFIETSLGNRTFHKIFLDEYRRDGVVKEASFKKYLTVIDKYNQAQMHPKNAAHVSAAEFVASLIPHEQVLPSYTYFNHDVDRYTQALNQAIDRLSGSPMGTLQFDLNPYNVLEGGIIDFELVGYGPIGYDSLMSAVWAGTWFTDYPSRYPIGYRLSSSQIEQHTKLIDTLAEKYHYPRPSGYMNEFLLLKSAWAVSDFEAPQPDWPDDKLAFRRFRTNVLQAAVDAYLANRDIDYMSFPSVKGGEINI